MLGPYLLSFAKERERVRLAREAGSNGPWTEDIILQKYRFCNVNRENDRVTKWIAKNWRDPNADEPDLWFAMAVARMINWPDTLAALGFPVPWNWECFLSVMSKRTKEGKRVYNNAYMIRSDTRYKGKSKAEYQVFEQFNPWWACRETLRPKPGDTLNSYHILLGQLYGMGSFMAGQVVADLKYVEPLRSAADWMTFAASGPGSRRGLNRVLGREVNAPWKEDDWRLELSRLQEWFNNSWPYEPLHGQDMQNVLCEFDKYCRAQADEGSLRRFAA